MDKGVDSGSNECAAYILTHSPVFVCAKKGAGYPQPPQPLLLFPPIPFEYKLMGIDRHAGINTDGEIWLNLAIDTALMR